MSDPTQKESLDLDQQFKRYGHRNFEFEFEKFKFKIVQKCEISILC